MEQSEFDQLLSEHCAPVLLGCKISNLVSVKKENTDTLELFLDDYRRLFSGRSIKIRILCSGACRQQLFLYHPGYLLENLYTESSQKILIASGYPPKAPLENYLNILSERMSSGHEFPHEIGLFLGYPAEDVLGFQNNKGQNYLLCRYWKVYGHAEEASRIFDVFDHCREYMRRCLRDGFTLSQILEPELCA